MAIAEHSVAPEQIQSYVDRELTAEESAVVEAHIASCDTCRELASSFHSVSGALRQWRVEASPDSVQIRLPKTGLTTRVSARSRVFASVAAMLLLAVGFGMYRSTALSNFMSHGDKPESVSTSANASLEYLADAQAIPAQTPRVRGSQGQGQGRAPGRPAGYGGYYPFATPSPSEPRPVAPKEKQALTGSQSQAQLPGNPARSAMVVRTVALSLLTRSFDDVRPSIDRILAQTGGFVGNIEASAARGDARWLRGTVRVPATQLATTLDAVKKLGTVVSESQGGEDVTDQATDLDARLANARETEKRLVQVLQQRTGKVGDILEVEREIARVREEIERMAAQRANLADRVSYATISLEIREEEKASLNIDPPSAGGRLRNAFVEGVATAIESGLSATALLIRIAPTLLLWIAILAWPVIVAGRRVRTLFDRA